MTTHLVDPDLPDEEIVVRAFCGAEGIEVSDELPMIPEDFDYVFWPDPQCFCDCMPCLEVAAQRLVRVKEIAL